MVQRREKRFLRRREAPVEPPTISGAVEGWALRSVVVAAPIPVIVHSSDGRVHWLSDEFTRLTGYTRDDLASGWRGIARELGEGDLEPGWDECQQVAALASDGDRLGPMARIVRAKDGREMVWSFQESAPLSKSGDASLIVTMAVDVTQQEEDHRRIRRLSCMLEQDRARLQTLLDTLPSGVVVIEGRDGTVSYTNARARELYGARLEGLGMESYESGVGLFHLSGEPFRAEELPASRALLDGAVVREADVVLRRQDGSDVVVRVSAAPVIRPDGEIAAAVAVFDDVTEMIRTREELDRSRAELEAQVEERTRQLDGRTMIAEQRARQLQRLALELSEAEDRERAAIAELLHDDLQQMLAAVRFQAEAVGAVAEGPGSLLDLVDGCIAKTRSLAHELRPPALRNQGLLGGLGWLAEWMETSHGLRVTITSSLTAEPVDERIRSVLFKSVRELLFNVTKHAGVSTASLVLGNDAKRMCVTVADEGRGFGDARTGDSWAPRPGFGLLGIRERLEHLGGTIRVVSGLGEGTRVTLTLPLDPD